MSGNCCYCVVPSLFFAYFVLLVGSAVSAIAFTTIGERECQDLNQTVSCDNTEYFLGGIFGWVATAIACSPLLIIAIFIIVTMCSDERRRNSQPTPAVSVAEPPVELAKDDPVVIVASDGVAVEMSEAKHEVQEDEEKKKTAKPVDQDFAYFIHAIGDVEELNKITSDELEEQLLHLSYEIERHLGISSITETMLYEILYLCRMNNFMTPVEFCASYRDFLTEKKFTTNINLRLVTLYEHWLSEKKRTTSV